ncbi:hypothetical protein PIIN_02712 [Serendipita indica DSM 11827]|uniref:Uncharacterized protein n=1 Tax=Serendipita indica (strain DSM 11827) TaxID=1109443 RepID=G4TBZ2_SERID|nr:hypothetical protein PIIN_02712 [Serendipita indica DSM 11827]
MKAIELMKLRRKAEPANPRDDPSSVPMDERLIVEVTYNTMGMALWVKNDVIAGRALDLFAAKMRVHVSPVSSIKRDERRHPQDGRIALCSGRKPV